MIDPEELTRRLWLLRLGSGVALAGWSGMDLSAAESSKLPPGLYEPSINHLALVLKPEPANGSAPAPRFFNDQEYAKLTELVGLILGEDPQKAPVPEIAAWIDLIVHDSAKIRKAAQSLSAEHRALAAGFYGETAANELETLDPQELCRTGLARLKLEQSGLLDVLESQNDPFLRWFKQRVIEGFYTSQAGLKELDYKGNSFYSESPGCND